MLTRRLATALVLVAAVPVLAGAGCEPRIGPGGPGPRHDGDRGVRLNEVQVLASHNSYHVQPEPTLLAALRAALGDAVNGWEYTHRSLADEFDVGVRQVELDAFVDTPEGGHYASPVLIPALGLQPQGPRMSGPGLKVFHIQEVDFRSTCPTFVDCLTQVKAWSDAHPRHLPITIQVEPKDDPIADPGLGFAVPLPWTTDAFATLEDEIRSVFSSRDIITPGRVMGHHASLPEAVEADGWPTLAQARGKVMFLLDDSGEERALYRQLRPDVADRLIFVSAAPPEPDAAMVVVNDPVGDGDRIHDLVDAGYIVRTRADADTVEARTGDTSVQAAAWASGAQFVSTDYPFPEELFGTGYVAEVPGPGVARCNPVSAPPRCPTDGLRP
jgi:hypothetical protein